MTGLCPFLDKFLFRYVRSVTTGFKGLNLSFLSISRRPLTDFLWQCKVLLSLLSLIGSLRLRGLLVVLARMFSLARPLVILVDSVRAVSFVLLPANRWVLPALRALPSLHCVVLRGKGLS